jgi:DNA-binding MarR family transcriptional regulator
MPTEPRWLNRREDRAWRAFKRASYLLDVRLNRHLLHDSRLTQAEYEVLVVLSEHSTDRMPARELCATLSWEKSRLSHQIRGMQERGLIAREANPDDARSVVIRLLPAGRRAIENAAPAHVDRVRQHLIDLFTPAELETFATLNERVLRHLAEEPFSEHPVPDASR